MSATLITSLDIGFIKKRAIILSCYNIEWKAVFVPGSHKKFLGLHFDKLPKFHSHTIFICL